MGDDSGGSEFTYPMAWLFTRLSGLSGGRRGRGRMVRALRGITCNRATNASSINSRSEAACAYRMSPTRHSAEPPYSDFAWWSLCRLNVHLHKPTHRVQLNTYALPRSQTPFVMTAGGSAGQIIYKGGWLSIRPYSSSPRSTHANAEHGPLHSDRVHGVQDGGLTSR